MKTLNEYYIAIQECIEHIESRVTKYTRLISEEAFEDMSDDFFELPYTYYQSRHDIQGCRIYAIGMSIDNDLEFYGINGEDELITLYSDDVLSDKCFFEILDRL